MKVDKTQVSIKRIKNISLALKYAQKKGWDTTMYEKHLNEEIAKNN